MHYISMKLAFKSDNKVFPPLKPVYSFLGTIGYALWHISCIQRKSSYKYACKFCKMTTICDYSLCGETNISHLRTDLENFNPFEGHHFMDIDYGFLGNRVVKSGEIYSALLEQHIPISSVIGTVNYIGPVAGFENLLNAS